MPRSVEAYFEIVARGRAPHLLAEETFDLTTRQANIMGYVDECFWFRKISLHHFDDGEYLRVLNAETCA
ncbi:hypothetical protein D9M72_637460 [compost metagenome]